MKKSKVMYASAAIALGAILFVYKNSALTSNECIFKYMSKTNSDIGARYIKEACYDLGLKGNPEIKKKKAKCVIEEILKVKNDAAIRAVRNACMYGE